jgi:putative tryptophan/tyrosine transport system substrate-binding protein
VNRRELIGLLRGATTMWSHVALASRRRWVIGLLGSRSPGEYAPSVPAFRQGLSETGYVEGQNVVIEYRWAERSYDRLPALAADLVGRKVDQNCRMQKS